MDKTKTANCKNDVVAAIITLHKSGLLDWRAKDGAAQAELTVIVDDADDEKGSNVPVIRVSREVSPDFVDNDGECIAEDFEIDSATYDLLVTGIPHLYEK